MPDERFRIIFEGQGDLDPILNKLTDALNRLAAADPFEKINESIERATRAMDETVAKTASAFTAVTRSVEMLGQSLRQIPTEHAERLEQGMQRVATVTERSVLTFGRLQALLGAVAHSASRMFDAFGTQTRALAEGLGQALGGTLSQIGEGLGGFASGRLGGNLFSPILQAGRDAVNGVLDAANAMVQGIVNASQTAVKAVANAWGEIQRAIATGIGSLAGFVASFIPFVGQSAALAGAMIGNAVGSALKAITDLKAGLLSGALSIAAGVADVVTGALQAAVNVATSILNNLVTVAQNIVERIAQAFGSLVSKVAGIAGNVVSKTTLVLTGLAGVAGAQAVKFRDAMAVTFGLVAEEGPAAFRRMTAEVREVMADTPFISWEEGARAMFQAISFGIREPQERLDALRASIELAVGGGMRELGTSMQAIARLMDQFNVGAAEAADRIFTIQNQASLTVGQLAQGIGNVIGPARLAGQSLDEIGSALTFISRVLPAEETFTSLGRALLSLVSPTPGSATAFEEFGIQLRDASNQLLPLSRIIEQLRQANLSDQQLVRLFPNIRALRGIVPLLMASADETERMIRSMGEFSGASQRAAEVVRSQLGAQLSTTWSQFTALVDTVVERIEGPLSGALGELQDYLEELRKSPGFDVFADAVGKALSSVVRFVRDGIEYVVENWAQIERTAVKAWRAIEAAATTAYGVLNTTYGLIKDWATAPPEEGIASVWDRVQAASSRALDVLLEYSKGNVTPLRVEFEKLWVHVETRGLEAWTKIKDAAIRALQDVVVFLGQEVEKLILGDPRSVIRQILDQFGIGLSGSSMQSLLGFAGVDVQIPEQERKQELTDWLNRAYSGLEILERNRGATVHEVLNDLMMKETAGAPPGTRGIPRLPPGFEEMGIDRDMPVEEARRILEEKAEIYGASIDAMRTGLDDVSDVLRDFAGDAEEKLRLIQADREKRLKLLNEELEENRKKVEATRKAAAALQEVGERLSSVPGVFSRAFGRLGDALGRTFARFTGGLEFDEPEMDGAVGGGGAPQSRPAAPPALPPPPKPTPRGRPAVPSGDAGGAGGHAAGRSIARSVDRVVETIYLLPDIFEREARRRTERAAGPFGLGFGPQGTPVDVANRVREQVEGMFQERNRLLRSLTPDARQEALGRLSGRYSLNDLRGVIRELQREREEGPRLEFEVPDPRNQRGGSYPGLVPEEEIAKAGEAAEAAEKLAQTADASASKEIEAGQRLITALQETISIKQEQLAAADEKDTALREMLAELVELLREELQRLKVQEIKQRAQEARRQLAGGGGKR